MVRPCVYSQLLYIGEVGSSTSSTDVSPAVPTSDFILPEPRSDSFYDNAAFEATFIDWEAGHASPFLGAPLVGCDEVGAA